MTRFCDVRDFVPCGFICLDCSLDHWLLIPSGFCLYLIFSGKSSLPPPPQLLSGQPQLRTHLHAHTHTRRPSYYAFSSPLLHFLHSTFSSKRAGPSFQLFVHLQNLAEYLAHCGYLINIAECLTLWSCFYSVPLFLFELEFIIDTDGAFLCRTALFCFQPSHSCQTNHLSSPVDLSVAANCSCYSGIGSPRRFMAEASFFGIKVLVLVNEHLLSIWNLPDTVWGHWI